MQRQRSGESSPLQYEDSGEESAKKAAVALAEQMKKHYIKKVDLQKLTSEKERFSVFIDINDEQGAVLKKE